MSVTKHISKGVSLVVAVSEHSGLCSYLLAHVAVMQLGCNSVHRSFFFPDSSNEPQFPSLPGAASLHCSGNGYLLSITALKGSFHSLWLSGSPFMAIALQPTLHQFNCLSEMSSPSGPGILHHVKRAPAPDGPETSSYNSSGSILITVSHLCREPHLLSFTPCC